MSSPQDPDAGTPRAALAEEQPRTPAEIRFAERSERYLWIEVAVVLSFAVIPYLSLSVLKICFPEVVIAYPFRYLTLSLVTRSLAVSLPILFIVWRSGDPWSSFGLLRPRWASDFFSGLGIWFLGMVLWYGFAWMLYLSSPGAAEELWRWGSDTTFVPPTGATDHVLLVIASCCNGFAEELAMRGYLIPRLERLLGSTWVALWVATALFAGYHIYQGLAGVIGAALLGLLYGAVFCRFRRIWPIAIAHAIADVVAMIALKQ